MFKEIKWSKEELRNIKKVIHRSNLTVNKSGQLIVSSELLEYTQFNNKIVNPYFQYDKEISNLVYLQDFSLVDDVLELSKDVIYDKENPNHYGLVKTISELNTNDRSEVFYILRDLIALFNTVAYDAASIIFSNCLGETNKLREQINEFKNSTDETFEEIYAEFKINEILKDTNGICDSPLFMDVVNKGMNNMKSYILNHLQTRLAHNIRSELIMKNSDTNQYINNDVIKKTKNKKNGRSAYNSNPL